MTALVLYHVQNFSDKALTKLLNLPLYHELDMIPSNFCIDLKLEHKNKGEIFHTELFHYRGRTTQMNVCDIQFSQMATTYLILWYILR